MSVKIMGLVWEAPLPRDQKFILLCYADHANHDGGDIWPAKERIQKMTSYSERSVFTITASLVEAGIMIREGRTASGTVRYRINRAKLETMIYQAGHTAIPKNISAPGVLLEEEQNGGAEFAGVQNLQVQKTTKGGADSAPKPSVEPSRELFAREAVNGSNPTDSEIYKAYPRHVAPDAAMKAIAKARKKKPAAFLLERATAYAKAVKIAHIEKQYIPHPATWFNAGRYDDDPAEWFTGGSAPIANTNNKPITKNNALL